ncbi:hypothetical protein HELRODRAFT_164826 [Helobdella robusta]|uniref:Uncharacterized protein n=1 Tax=Helobdella robusta TaxID=6412 RepID=T1EVV0_HELRO|nr:hypothetical protein HELRODRAFT_164826 [Helobdella robusta]ESN92729.1 hypothetical protein HELRODRAFT_164826 [Helobdella robusta]
MAAKRVCIAEILWFLLNNQENLNDEGFKLEVVEFYTNDEILNGKKILLTEIEGLKKDKIKLKARGNTKYDKVSELLELIKLCFDNNLMDLLPTFTIYNIYRIPLRLARDNSKNINDNLIKLNDKIEKNKQLIVQLAKQLNNRSDSARTCNTCEQQSNNGKDRLQRIESVNSASLLSGDNVDNCASKKSWADRTAKRYTSQSESCDEIIGDDGFQVVRSKKRKKSSTSPQLASPKPASKPTSKQMKTYGTGISCPLKASKIIEEKITYYIGNKNPDDPLVEKSQTTESTAFKIIIPLNEREKLVNPDIWPMHTFLREWDYTCQQFKTIYRFCI